MNMNYAMKKNIILSILALNICMTSICWSGNKNTSANSQSINELEFKKTEDKVIEYLKGSWCSKEKAELIMDLVITKQPKKCVEIGTFTGSSSLPLLASLAYLNNSHAYLIDAWSNKEAIKGLNPQDPNAIWWSTLDMAAVKSQCLHMIQDWNLNSYCTVIHSSSKAAASKMNSIDFLLLDGNFSEEGALLDTELYLPKVKSGGYILLSNILVMIDQKPTKLKALWPIFDQCEIVKEIENGNTILFQKK